MTSQNSTNKNKKAQVAFGRLLCEDLRRKTWMIALSLLGSFLAGPVTFLFAITNHRVENEMIPLQFMDNPAEYLTQRKAAIALSLLNRYGLTFHLVIAFVGALIVGWFGFRYLFSKRMVDLYHSAPVSRGRLFLASWLSGFLVWLVPYALCALFVSVSAAFYIGSSAYLGSLVFITFRNLLFLTLCYLIVYHTCLVGVMISGNVVNTFVNTLIYGLFFAVAYLCYYGLMSVFMENFYHPGSLYGIWVLSPLTTPVVMMIKYGSGYPFAEWAWLPICSCVLMLLNGALAYLLYKKRPSELSERGVDNKWVRIILRAGISLLSGLAFSLFFYLITGYAQLPWMLFGAFFGSALSFCVLNIIYHASFKEIFSHKKQYVIVLAVTAVICLGTAFDVFGYNTYLPSRSSIKGICINYPSLQNVKYYEMGPDGIVRSDTGNAFNSRLRYDDPEAAHALLQALVSPHPENAAPNGKIYVRVFTNWGSYYRQYHLYDDQLETLRPFVETDAYRKDNYPHEDLALGMPESITLTPLNRKDVYGTTITDPDRIRRFMENYHQDFIEHYSLEGLCRTNLRGSSMRCIFSLAEGGVSYTVTFPIPEWYERTIALLEEWCPRYAWRTQTAEITDLLVFDLHQETDGRLDLLYEYFGYSEGGAPLQPPASWNQASPAAAASQDRWCAELTQEMIEQLRPHLLLGSYSNRLTLDYVPLGQATLQDGTKIDCYVAYGKMPPELIRYLHDFYQSLGASGAASGDPSPMDYFYGEVAEDIDAGFSR